MYEPQDEAANIAQAKALMDVSMKPNEDPLTLRRQFAVAQAKNTAKVIDEDLKISLLIAKSPTIYHDLVRSEQKAY